LRSARIAPRSRSARLGDAPDNEQSFRNERAWQLQWIVREVIAA